MIKRFGLLILMFAVSSISQASIDSNGFVQVIENGIELKYACNGFINSVDNGSTTKLDNHNGIVCYNYLKAVSDSHNIMRGWIQNYEDAHLAYCADDANSIDIIRKIVVYLTMRPERLAESGAVLITEAMTRSYPCPKS